MQAEQGASAAAPGGQSDDDAARAKADDVVDAEFKEVKRS
jgi:hypothetical protein